MAIDLMRRVGTRDCIILKRNNDFGGTWNKNRYPGSCSEGKLINPITSWAQES